jgi:hypothetical protein
MFRTQSTMNNANKPEWMTTISIDIYDQSEWLFISVFYYQKADNTQSFAACKVKLSEWCKDLPASGFVELENGAGKLFLKSEYVHSKPDYDSDETMQI